MSGYLNRSKGNKKQWKRLWFVIKNKVLYTYAASEVLMTGLHLHALKFSSSFSLFSVQCFWAALLCVQDVAALESQPLLGFFLREEKNGPAQKLQFKLYHKNTLFYIFKADDIPTAQRFVTFLLSVQSLKQNTVTVPVTVKTSVFLFFFKNPFFSSAQMDRSLSGGDDSGTGMIFDSHSSRTDFSTPTWRPGTT